MDVLLHICCAPCAIEVIRELEDTGFNKIAGFFYNPNIHPLVEFEQRKRCLEDYIKEFEDLKVYYPEYNPREFFQAVDYELDSPLRCKSCWVLRLQKTAEFADQNNIPCFTTTLLISPYQNQETIRGIGNSLAKKYNLKFIDRNFRKLYSQGRKIAKDKGLYRQDYCGCLFSELERYNKKIKNKY